MISRCGIGPERPSALPVISVAESAVISTFSIFFLALSSSVRETKEEEKLLMAELARPYCPGSCGGVMAADGCLAVPVGSPGSELSNDTPHALVHRGMSGATASGSRWVGPHMAQ